LQLLRLRRKVRLIFTEPEFSIFDFASCISEAMDLVSPFLNNHHKKVAYLSYRISVQMGLPDDEVIDIVLAAVLHDIGAFTVEERLDVIQSKFRDSSYDQHSVMGYNLLKGFQPLSNAAAIIKHHHAHYGEATEGVPQGSHVVHLADRVSVMLSDQEEVFGQVPGIMREIETNRAMFHPDSLKALKELEGLEYFWIEACLVPAGYTLPDRLRNARELVDLESLRSFAKVIAHFIDYRSRFTSTHSSGVAAVALELTRLSGFSERECRLMEIAGFFHDIGKLAISNDILEKNSALSDEEINEMRKHTYYTYVILNKIKGLEHISTWAAHHHEKLDGSGYPFHVRGENFSKLSRIMAVADIFTAITEDRPYRAGMSSEDSMRVLRNLVHNNSVDGAVVALAAENVTHLIKVRAKAQQEAFAEYAAFRNI